MDLSRRRWLLEPRLSCPSLSHIQHRLLRRVVARYRCVARYRRLTSLESLTPLPEKATLKSFFGCLCISGFEEIFDFRKNEALESQLREQRRGAGNFLNG